MKQNKHSLLSLVFVALGVLAGCGTENKLGRQGVSGSVTLDGRPIANGTIRFEPVAEDGVASGTTITQGKYDISAARGLPPGEYLVRISAAGESGVAEPLPGDSSKLAEELVPEKYNTNSELKVAIKKGSNESQDFLLKK